MCVPFFSNFSQNTQHPQTLAPTGLCTYKLKQATYAFGTYIRFIQQLFGQWNGITLYANAFNREGKGISCMLVQENLIEVLLTARADSYQ